MGVKVTVRYAKGRNAFLRMVDAIKGELPSQVADGFRKELLKNIDTNRYKFQLSPKWESYKASLGASTKPFVMFGHYKKGIQVTKQKGKFTVGFDKKTIHPRAGVSLSKLAVHLEYGDADIGLPARPLWRNSADDYFTTRNKKLRKLIIKVIT